MRIDMVRPILGIVFENKDRRLFPDRTMGYVFDQPAKGQVVVGNLGDRAISSFMQTAGMIVRKIDRAKTRDGPGLNKRVEVMFKYGFPEDILYGKVPARVFRAIVLRLFEDGKGRVTVVHEFSIVAEGYSGAITIVQDKSFSRIGYGRAAIKIIIPAAAAIVVRPVLFYKVGSIPCHGPVVAIGADFRIHIKIIQEDKITGQGMFVGRDLIPEKTKAAVAVAFGHVAQHVCIGTIFL